MSGEPFFLDTNILVYANDRSDPPRQTTAARLVAHGLRSHRAVVSSQVLSEFWVTVTRKVAVPLPFDMAEKELVKLRSMVVVAIEYDTVVAAIHMQQRYDISYWDSLILAAALRARCSIVYSEDLGDGQRYGDLLVQNPFV